MSGKYYVSNVYKNIKPGPGCNGYFDADYMDLVTGKEIRFVRQKLRIGSIGYPKRLEGTLDIFRFEHYTEDERALYEWTKSHGKFAEIAC
uniref:hypothetical protein n=1 Tax=Lachnoclostridium phocaeense TaxID=1871021 RepID=UPI0026DC8EED|nr:hypothetical protein [Lachnoclostridium phocaeense]